MSQEELKKLVKVLPINPDSENIIFIDKAAMSMEDGHKLARLLRNSKANFNSICMTYGNPNDAVKLITAESREQRIDEIKDMWPEEER